MTNKQKINIVELCRDAGMTQEDFARQIEKAYVAIISCVFDINPGKNMVECEVDFGEHKIVVSARRVPVESNRTIN